MKKQLSFFFLVIAVLQSASAQQVKHWELIAGPGNNWQFYNSLFDPATDWTTVYDSTDHDWKACNGIIADGIVQYAGLNTSVPDMQSAMLRRSFSIYDTAALGNVIFYADYRHGFVAWLNGTEICRSPELFGRVPAFSDTAGHAHPLFLPNGGLPERFAIDSKVFRSAIQPGNNVLSIQIVKWVAPYPVTIKPYLFAEVNTDSITYEPVTSWFVPSEVDSSSLPLIILNTHLQVIPEHVRIKASMGIIDNGPGLYNHLNDPFNGYNGHISIEIRGNSVLGVDKRSYNVETQDAFGENNNVSILGMPAENDWILNAAYFDRTMIRNPLMHKISELSGEYAPRYRWCELIVDGHYRGVYLFMEKIKRDANRVNIKHLTVTENTLPEVSGGYIFEALFSSIKEFKYPDADVITAQQLSYITDYFNKTRMYLINNFKGDSLELASYIDIRSFIHQFIVQEISKNKDAYNYSMFYYKDKEKPLCSGPVWDFDWSLGNDAAISANYKLWIPSHPDLWNPLFKSKSFRYWLKQEWKTLRADKLSNHNLLSFIDSMAVQIDTSIQLRNFRRWPELGRVLWLEPSSIVQRTTYKSEVDYLKQYVVKRLAWLDSTINLFEKPVVTNVAFTQSSDVSMTLYPNPTSGFVNVNVNSPHQSVFDLQVLSITGSIVKTAFSGLTVNGNWNQTIDISNLPQGIYFIRLKSGNGAPLLTKLVKTQ
jgi:hypothetical protein